jgi:ketosteroid isomerase-like protein
MSVESIVREAIAATNERGIDGLLEYTTEDVVWHAPPEYPEGGEWHGREALAKAWHAQFDSVFENVHSDVESVEVVPIGYLASVASHGRAQGSGIELDWHSYFLGALEGDLIKEIWVFNDRAGARRQAGLESE